LGGLNQIRVGADGAFQIPNVAPGSYYLSASANDSGQRYTGRVRVDVAAADIKNAVIEVRPGLEVHGRITLDNPPTQFKMSQLRVNLVEAGNPAGDLVATIGNLLQGAGGSGAARGGAPGGGTPGGGAPANRGGGRGGAAT